MHFHLYSERNDFLKAIQNNNPGKYKTLWFLKGTGYSFKRGNSVIFDLPPF